jgi:peptidoglycan hydrolase CwlO-like protein
MPLSTAEKTSLQTSVQSVADQVAALVVDTVDIVALQAELAAVQAERDAAIQQILALQAKIENAKAALA